MELNNNSFSEVITKIKNLDEKRSSLSIDIETKDKLKEILEKEINNLKEESKNEITISNEEIK